MILEYSYDKAMNLLEKFKNGELAYLSIQQVKGFEDENRFAMEYNLITDYPELKQNIIKIVLSNSLPLRLDVINVLNKFIENQLVNNIEEFSLKFNAVNVQKCEIDYSIVCKTVLDSNCNHVELVNCLDRFDSIITKMGIGDVKLKNVFYKELGVRNKKNIPLTISDFSRILKKSLVEK